MRQTRRWMSSGQSPCRRLVSGDAAGAGVRWAGIERHKPTWVWFCWFLRISPARLGKTRKSARRNSPLLAVKNRAIHKAKCAPGKPAPIPNLHKNSFPFPMQAVTYSSLPRPFAQLFPLRFFGPLRRPFNGAQKSTHQFGGENQDQEGRFFCR